jgi:putative DNA methylase
MTSFGDLFTPRQLVALTTFSDLALAARTKALEDATAAGMAPDPTALGEGGTGAQAYADSLALYLAFAVSGLADRLSSICTWPIFDSWHWRDGPKGADFLGSGLVQGESVVPRQA